MPRSSDSTDPERAGSRSLTLERGLSVLRVLADHPEGMSVSELAKVLGTHRPGLYRLLGPLIEQRFVRRGDGNRYTLGLGLIELASRVEGRLQEVALPELQLLADEIEATTALTIKDNDEAIVLAVVEPRNTDMHIAYRPGLRHRLDQAASGIAILASLEPVPGERAAITEARERGWAVSSGELLRGTTGIGVPLRVPDTDASVSAVWISERDDAAMARHAIATVRRIEAALHGAGNGAPPDKSER